VRPMVDSVSPLEQAANAFERAAVGHKHGRMVLSAPSKRKGIFLPRFSEELRSGRGTSPCNCDTSNIPIFFYQDAGQS
jgi:hypothetical protein